MNRSPSAGSLAAEILSTQYPMLGLKNTQAIRSSIKDLTETLSDFNSCNSTLDSSSSEEDSTPENTLELGSIRGIKKGKKRGRQRTPGKEVFLKKANIEVSPQ